VLASRTRIFIVLELVTGGELFDKIVSTGRFDEPTARAYFRQLICGARACRRQSAALHPALSLGKSCCRSRVLPPARRLPPRPQAGAAAA